jgi:Ni2+-binding GTPase involved in maturation of urease and hydrogenase
MKIRLTATGERGAGKTYVLEKIVAPALRAAGYTVVMSDNDYRGEHWLEATRRPEDGP